MSPRTGSIAALLMASVIGVAAQPPAAPRPARPAAAAPKPSAPAGQTVAIINARILPVSGPAIERGTIVLSGGRIASVGSEPAIPANARVIDAAGKIVTPGWMDAGVQTGITEISSGAEGTTDDSTNDPRVSAAFTVVDAFNGNSTVIPVTRIEGITRQLVIPSGTGNVFAGQAAVFDLSGAQVPDAVTRAPAAMLALLGENGASVAGGSRSTAILRMREMLEDARDFAAHRASFDTAQRREYVRSRLDLEALLPVLKRDVPLLVLANRASDLLAAVRLAQEFNLRLILMGAAEGWMVAGDLARAHVPVVINALTDIPSFDSLGATLENAARLSEAGVTVELATFDTYNSRDLRQIAGNAIAYGMDRDAALKAVTLTPATIWGVADRVGSLEVGKDADVVVWSGDPFELSTGAEHVFIKGREMPPDTRQTKLVERYRHIK